MGFLVLVVVNLVAGFQVLGTLMVVGMMMLPAASARFWALSAARQIPLAAGLGLFSSVAGLLVSYHFNVPASPAIILAAGGCYLFPSSAAREAAAGAPSCRPRLILPETAMNDFISAPRRRACWPPPACACPPP